MKRLPVRFWSLLLLVAPLAWAKTPFFPYPLKVSTLPNGLTVVRVPFSSPGLVAYYTVVRVGSRNEVEAGKTGFAHFFEHMMFKGTPTWPEGKREAILGKLGFSENAFTTDDITVYHVVGPSTSLKTLVALEADRFMNLAYSEATFETEAKAVLGEYHKNAANPGLKIEEALLATAFQKHTYRHTTLGIYEDVKAMPQAYAHSKVFFRKWYTPDNTLLFVVGDFSDVDLMREIESAYGTWKGRVAVDNVPKEPPQVEQKQVHIEWPSPTLPRHLHAWKTPSSLKDAAVQNVLSAYLVGSTSPTYRDLVLERQLVESVQSGYADHREPGLFILSATLKSESARTEVKKAFERAISEVVSGKMDAQRIQDIKENLRYGLLMSLETPNDVALQLGYFAGIFGTHDALEQLYQAISNVQPRDLQAFVKEYFPAKNRVILTFAPKASQTESK